MSDASLTPDESTPLLRALAQRVRERRRRLGWTRSDLARASGLSVRFLARVEAGDGNISILRLADLARALGVGVDVLLREVGPPQRVIALVGMRGAGKSTIGPALARALDQPFVEMDSLISDAAGLPIDQIFELHGPRHYRRLERETLLRVASGDGGCVVAAAGGIVNDRTSWDLLLESAFVIWLRARPEDHWNRVIAQGDRRPMADNPAAMDELRAMLRAREALYAEAHATLDTSDHTPAELVRLAVEHVEVSSPAEVPARAAR